VRIKTAFIVVLYFLLSFRAYAGTTLNTVTQLINRANKYSFKKPEISLTAKEEAAKVYKLYRSKEFQQEINHYKKEIKAEFLNNKNSYLSYYTSIKKNLKYYLLPEEKIYICISSSIPLTTLRAYAADLDKLKDPNIILVMRGFVNGMEKIEPTLDFIRKILIKHPGNGFNSHNVRKINIEIDPLIFRRYHINEVPAFIYTNKITKEAYILYGDVKLRYAIQKFKEYSNSQSLRLILKSIY